MVDAGGSFETVRHEYYGSHPAISIAPVPAIQGYYAYNGPLLAVGPAGPGSLLWPSIPTDLRSTMIQMGTTAIARTIPTNPASGVGQFLGELREGLPSLVGSKLRNSSSLIRGSADEYLNYEFGVKPLISDVQNFVTATMESDKILKQLRRDSGRLVRRRYSFPVTRTTEVLEDGTGTTRNPYPPLDTRLFDAFGKRFKTRETVSRTWFSGAYTYHFNQGQRLWDKMERAEQEANRLYGLRLSPALAWELAPWSWAVDWVTNLGDVMTNISAFSRDGLVLVYGYVMTEMSITDTYVLPCTPHGMGRINLVQRFTTRVKKRVKATPYGFGLDPDWKDFSVRQLAILGALGITRSNRGAS